MDIYAQEGDKVIFLGKHGRDEELAYALRKLEAGKEYTVDHTDVHSWCSYVYLKELPEESFNTVMFEDANE